MKDLLLPKPKIKFSIKETENDFIVMLTTDKLAKNLYLRLDDIDGRFSDNYFDLLPGKSTEIEFVCQKKISLESFQKALNIFTILDSFQ